MIAYVCSCNASRRTQGGIDRLVTFVLDGLRERELSATRRCSRVPMHFAVQFDDAPSRPREGAEGTHAPLASRATLVYLRRKDRAKDMEAVRDLSWVLPCFRPLQRRPIRDSNPRPFLEWQREPDPLSAPFPMSCPTTNSAHSQTHCPGQDLSEAAGLCRTGRSWLFEYL